MAGKKIVKATTYLSDNYIDDKGILFCVKTKYWENGLLKAVDEKKFFKKEKDAREYYNQVNRRGYQIELTKIVNGNERTVEVKFCDN